MPQDPVPTLADSPSPFLRHGATQPVNWTPWGEEAFERARRAVKPILLDIGAVWCHWCHVMDRESYEDPETARLVNELFVPVKVDRDERPDVDARYQRAVQAISGQGGWPLTAFLTPEGEVFYGGTYFPPVDGFGRPSFKRVLAEVARVWRDERGRALDAARSVRERLATFEEAESRAGEIGSPLVDHAVEELARVFDFRWGGFGAAPKFPNAGALLLLLDRWLDEGEDWALRIVHESLRAMAQGGIHDHLGGGFHRYATDAKWLIPHFEKMAYDNGTLLEAYARAAAVVEDPVLAETAAGIAAHYRDIAPALVEAGGFPASQDADHSPDDDGDYWTWTLPELRAALGADERLVRAAVLRWGLERVDTAMHQDPARHVLAVSAGAAEIAPALGTDADEAAALVAGAGRLMKAARDARPRPFVDETLYAGWVGLVASGHIAAARHLGLEDAGRAALRALERVWDEAFDVEDGLAHRVGDGAAGAYLEDQAQVAQALLDAFEWTQDARWLERATRVADVLLRRFRDDDGAFRDRPADDAAPARPLAEPHRPIQDAPAPSGNAVAALVLLRLEALLHERRWGDAARATLSAFAGSAPSMATAAATYMRAVDWATAPVTSVVVVGDAADPAAAALLAAALSAYRPRTVVRRFEPGNVEPERLPPELAAMIGAEAPRAYVCVGRTCAAPVADAPALEDLLRTFGG